MKLRTLLESMTEDESEALSAAISAGGELEGWLHGWSAAVAFFRYHPTIAFWLSSRPPPAADSFVADVTMGVGLLLVRAGHDPTTAPPADLVEKILGLVEVEKPANPSLN